MAFLSRTSIYVVPDAWRTNFVQVCWPFDSNSRLLLVGGLYRLQSAIKMSLNYWTYNYKGSQVAKLFHQLCSRIILSVQWSGGLLGGTSAAGTAEQELQKKDFFPFLVFLFSIQNLSTQITDHGRLSSTGVTLSVIYYYWLLDLIVAFFVFAPQASVLSPSYESYGTRQTGWWKTRRNCGTQTIDYLFNCRYSYLTTEKWWSKRLPPSSSPSSTWSFAQVRWNGAQFQNKVNTLRASPQSLSWLEILTPEIHVAPQIFGCRVVYLIVVQ